MQLQEKRVLLTGATGGIGQAIAAKLAAAGAKLWLLGRNQSMLESLHKSLPCAERHRILVADLTDAEQRQVLTDALQGETLDLVINCAGTNRLAWLRDQTDQEIEQQLMLNLISPILLIRALLPSLNRDKSLIVNIGSSFGAIGYPGYTPYCAAKFGLRGFSEALRRELADTNTGVLYIAPRATDTPINSPSVREMNRELGNRMDDVDVVAKAVVKAIHTERPESYIGWPEKLFVLINKLNSGPVSKALAKQLDTIRRYATQARGES